MQNIYPLIIVHFGIPYSILHKLQKEHPGYFHTLMTPPLILSTYSSEKRIEWIRRWIQGHSEYPVCLEQPYQRELWEEAMIPYILVYPRKDHEYCAPFTEEDWSTLALLRKDRYASEHIVLKPTETLEDVLFIPENGEPKACYRGTHPIDSTKIKRR